MVSPAQGAVYSSTTDLDHFRIVKSGVPKSSYGGALVGTKPARSYMRIADERNGVVLKYR